MNKRQVLEAITPAAAVIVMFICGWLGRKGRWLAITLVCLAWLAFATWMLYR